MQVNCPVGPSRPTAFASVFARGTEQDFARLLPAISGKIQTRVCHGRLTRDNTVRRPTLEA
jgi:hypothetical protein